MPDAVAWSLQFTLCGWIFTFSPLNVASVAFARSSRPAFRPGSSSRPIRGYIPTANTARTKEPAIAFSEAWCTLAMSPRDVSAPMSCCRMPFSMFSVLPLREFCWLNRRSPPPPPSCLLFSHPTYALVTAKWSLPPPRLVGEKVPRRLATFP